MTEKEISTSNFEEAYKQAKKEITEKWYEKKLANKYLGVSITTLSLCFSILQSGAPSAPNLMGGAIFLLSEVADDITTMEVASAQGKGIQNGAPRKFEEKNPYLNHVVTDTDYRVAWKTRLKIAGIGSVILTIFPEVGIGLAAAKLTAAANNHRKATRYNRALEIAGSR